MGGLESLSVCLDWPYVILAMVGRRGGGYAEAGCRCAVGVVVGSRQPLDWGRLQPLSPLPAQLPCCALCERVERLTRAAELGASPGLLK